MNKIEKQFKKEFEESNKKIELTFDVSKLTPNTEPEVTFEEVKKKKGKTKRIVIFSSASLVVLAIAAVALSQMLEIESSVKTAKRNLSANAIAIAESNTFKRLNNVKYPEGEEPTRHEFTKNEMSAYNNFANETYHSLVNSSKKDNMSFASIGLYSIMNELYGAISREDLQDQFTNLLGLNETSRKEFYENVMKANSYASKDNTTQLKNAAFFNTDYQYSQEYVDKLTNLYCEAYTIDFKNEADKMVEWVNEAVDSKGFIDKEFLNMSKYSQLYYFSTLYFKNAWAYKYLSKDNIDDDFYLSDGSKKTAKYMCHSYRTDYYYDYGTYISFRDYYMGGNASITYLVPKKTSDNIFNLTKNANIFEENEAKKASKKEPYSDYYEPYMVNLKTPKFKVSTDIDLKASLENLGFASMFKDTYDSFHKAFSDPSTNDMNFYLEQVKQKNEVEFNEDGAIVKSVSMASVNGKDAAMERADVIDIRLNQPFIYIIRDCNGIPILVGHIDNPNY